MGWRLTFLSFMTAYYNSRATYVIITLHYTGSKFQQAIYQETIQQPQIKIKFFEECTHNNNKCWPYFNGFLLGQKIISLGPVALPA